MNDPKGVQLSQERKKNAWRGLGEPKNDGSSEG